MPNPIKSLTADVQSSDPATPVNLSQFDFAVTAGQKWLIEYNLIVKAIKNNTQGIRFQITGPVFPAYVLMTGVGLAGSPTSLSGDSQSAAGWVSSSLGWNSGGLATLPVSFRVSAVIGFTNGTLASFFNVLGAGNVLAIAKGSQMRATLET